MPLPRYTPQNLSRTADHFLRRDRAHEDAEDIFDLDPPYQRQSVWTTDQRRNLVKSLIMGLPVGAVWTNKRRYEPGAATFAVIDGRQRIETVRGWFDGAFDVPAAWWEPKLLADPGAVDDRGATVTYDDLSDTGQRACRIGWHIGELQVQGLRVAEEAELYLLVNYGGVPHEEADYRRAAAVASGGTP